MKQKVKDQQEKCNIYQLHCYIHYMTFKNLLHEDIINYVGSQIFPVTFMQLLSYYTVIYKHTEFKKGSRDVPLQQKVRKQY